MEFVILRAIRFAVELVYRILTNGAYLCGHTISEYRSPKENKLEGVTYQGKPKEGDTATHVLEPKWHTDTRSSTYR